MTEVIIYHVYNSETKPLPIQKSTGVRFFISKLLLRLAKIFAITGIIILAVNYAPFVAAWAQNGFHLVFKSNINLSQAEVQNITRSQASSRSNYLPLFDSRLPLANRLIIPTVGVNTDIQEATYDNYQSALKQGVWRVSDFGAPSANSMPTILAAHRFGYLVWTNLFRRQNSFYNLPKLNVGDTVEIDWRQRRYIYEVYSEDKGTQITDYSADLILYTCVDLTGPERIFRYARLINI
jgi:sortase (surface protein transpeptidase)